MIKKSRLQLQLRHWRCFLALAIACNLCENMAAQEKRPYQDAMLEMLYDSSVLDDLELVGEQKENVEKILSELSKHRSKQFHDLNKMSQGGASKAEIEAQKTQSNQLHNEHEAQAIQDLKNVSKSLVRFPVFFFRSALRASWQIWY